MVIRTGHSDAHNSFQKWYPQLHMAHVLETGFEILNRENPNGSPTVMGYNIINGELRSASDGETFESRNPAWLDDCLGVFPLSTKQDVHDAIASAREAFSQWSQTPAPTREPVLLTAPLTREWALAS